MSGPDFTEEARELASHWTELDADEDRLYAKLLDFAAFAYAEGVRAGCRIGIEAAARVAESDHALPIEQWMGTKKELTAHFARALAAAIRSLPIEPTEGT